MSSTGTENYSRILMTLMKGGTKLTRRLVEKTVKDLSKNGGEVTIDEFLLKNKSLILKQKLGKNKQDVFFPSSGHTNLDNWDICMFCFILEETCGLTYTMKMYIKKLLKIRNKLCHSNDPTLETRKFEEYTEQMKCSFEYCLKEINDDKFTEEINALVQSLATGPMSSHDLLKAVHKLYFIEMTNKEVLEKIENGQELTHGKLDTLVEKVERLESRLQSGASVDIPGIGIVIDVKNCSAEKKKEVLDILEKNFIKAIEQKVSSLEESLPKGVLHTLRETVAQVFQEFFIMGRRITFVEQKCLMLTIKCTSVKSFVKMIRDYRTGELSLQLSTIETAIKNLQGCGNVQLENLIFKEEFMEVMDDIVSKLYERVQQTEYTTIQTSSNADNSIRVRSKFPTLSEKETVQKSLETKMFGKGIKRIESELRRQLNVESKPMSLTTKLVKDDAVSNFGESYCFIEVNVLPTW
ncbi:uncharacterized protein LOC132752279 [Ruditapes philippinarum]|uniref:uncharacterized protein LOC132752279 n=1 Tax=Ruditapes philippinarum TaxID=129788 RepID=UPI00295C16A9|nr:uncharacterized protein LOC132752279 [Ruditapes philippinarum]